MTALPTNFAPTSCDAACCTAPPRAMPWLRLAIGLFVAAQTMLIGLAVNLTPPDDAGTRRLIDFGMLGATVLVIALLGGPLVADAFSALRRRRISMELLFLAGIAGALGVSLQSLRLGVGPVYFDVVSVLLTVYSAGRAISQHSRLRAMNAVASMRDLAPTARVIDAARLPLDSLSSQALDSSEVNVASVRAGDLIRVNAGELIPVDGVVVRGESFVRQTPFTGELVSRALQPGDAVVSGSGVEDGSLVIRATVDGGHRKLDRLVDLVEQAATNPPALQRQADRFVRWFLPIVLVIAVASFAYWARHASIEKGLYAGLAVLLVACPCAAGLATPLTLWVTLSRLAKLGLIATSGDAIERLASAECVVFDKTGTLADDQLTLNAMHWLRLPLPPGEGWGEGQVALAAESSANDSTLPLTLTLSRRERGPERLLAMVATVERGSAHPVAKVLTRLSDDTASFQLLRSRTVPARGVEGLVLDRETQHTHNVRLERDASVTDVIRVTVAVDGELVAHIDVAESLRASAAPCIAALKAQHLPVHIMTGDASAGPASLLAPSRVGMTPQDKHDALRSLPRPLFIGDGMNDAPALAAAHASIALASGSTLAVATASATLHGGDLSVVPQATGLARSAVRTIRSNLRWAIAYNLFGVTLAASGYLHPILAAVLMGVSSAMVSFRAFRETKDEGGTMKDEKGSTAFSLQPSAFSLPDQIPALSRGTGRRFKERAGSVVRKAADLGITTKTVLLVGWMLQGLLLVPILGFSPVQAIGLLLAFAIAARVASSWYTTLPEWLDMTLAMVAVGGVGMNLGWWADLGFQSARQSALSCCQTAGGVMTVPWMYVGMIALGTPAMYVLRRSPVTFSWRKWCCIGPLVLGVPGMVGGMWIGSIAARTLTVGWDGQLAGLVDAAMMTAGMVAGMLLPHALGHRED